MGEKKESGYSAGPFSVDEIGFIQIAPAKVLAAVARGEIDLNRIAREEMASRGLGLSGEWAGFEAARRIHGLDEKARPYEAAKPIPTKKIRRPGGRR